MQGYPIVFGLKLTQRFFSPGSQGIISTPNLDDPKSASHGLHAMLCVGYSDPDEVFIVRNSWGSGWGHNGYCYIPYDYMANGERCSLLALTLTALRFAGELGTEVFVCIVNTNIDSNEGDGPASEEYVGHPVLRWN